DGRTVAAASGESISFFEIARGKPVRKIKIPVEPQEQSAFLFSPDGKVAAAANLAGVISVFDLATGRTIATLTKHADLTCLAFSPDGKLLASGGRDKALRLWEVSSGKVLAKADQEHALRELAFSPDGTIVAIGREDDVA